MTTLVNPSTGSPAASASPPGEACRPGREIDRIASARLVDGRLVDIDVDDGVVVAVTPAASTDAAGPAVVDARGHLALTAPAEPHAHLDKALSWGATRPTGCDLGAAIDAWREFAAGTDTDEIHGRALTAARRLVANGTTAVRSHVDLHSQGDPLRGVRALARVRDDLAGQLDLQISVMVREEDPAGLVREAIAAGADLVGGAPHLAADTAAETHRLVDLAEVLDVGIDLHADEFLDGEHAMLAVYAGRVADWPAGRIRTAGHCCHLGVLSAPEQSAAAGTIAAAGLGLVTLPITNLYLQSRDPQHGTRRGLPPVRALLDGGVTVAAGADNVRDPFNPVGRSDAFETAMLLVVAAHLEPDEAWRLVTDGARAVLGLPPAGPAPGLRADLLLVRGTSLEEVLAEAPPDRMAVRAGRLISARTTVPVDPFRTHPSHLEETL